MSPSRVETVRQLLNNNHSNRQYQQPQDEPQEGDESKETNENENDEKGDNVNNEDSKKTEREALECAIALNPHFDGAYATLASLYEAEDGSSSRAQLVLEDCLKFANPRSSTAAYYLGTIHYRNGNYAKARQYMLLCLSVDPKDGDAMATLAQIHAQLGESRDEQAMYQQIIQTPGVSKRILSNAYCNSGTLMSTTNGEDGNLKQEMEYYLKSLEYDPMNMAALESLGSAFASQQQWDKAIACFRKVVDSSRSNQQQQEEVLVLLYRVATRKLQQMGTALQRQEQVLEQLANLMGQNNVDRLTAMQQPKR